MHWMPRLMPRLRTLLARHRWIYWTAVVAAAAAIAWAVTDALADLDRERRTWGRSTTVYVATAEIDVGDPIASSIEAVQVPEAMVPIAALRESPAVGGIARQRISTGEIVVTIDVANGGPVGLLPEGWLALTLEMPGSDGFAVGDHAAVLATGEVLAGDALVIQVLATGIVIGVPGDEAPAVANAISQRLAVVALAPR